MCVSLELPLTSVKVSIKYLSQENASDYTVLQYTILCGLHGNCSKRHSNRISTTMFVHLDGNCKIETPANMGTYYCKSMLIQGRTQNDGKE